jgi:hypothetical protein
MSAGVLPTGMPKSMIAISPDLTGHHRHRPGNERNLVRNFVRSHLSPPFRKRGTHPTGALITQQSNDQ